MSFEFVFTFWRLIAISDIFANSCISGHILWFAVAINTQQIKKVLDNYTICFKYICHKISFVYCSITFYMLLWTLGSVENNIWFFSILSILRGRWKLLLNQLWLLFLHIRFPFVLFSQIGHWYEVQYFYQPYQFWHRQNDWLQISLHSVLLISFFSLYSFLWLFICFLL